MVYLYTMAKFHIKIQKQPSRGVTIWYRQIYKYEIYVLNINLI